MHACDIFKFNLLENVNDRIGSFRLNDVVFVRNTILLHLITFQPDLRREKIIPRKNIDHLCSVIYGKKNRIFRCISLYIHHITSQF